MSTRRKRQSRPRVWTWISFILFGLIIALLGTSLIKKQSPAEVLRQLFTPAYVEGDLTTYGKDQLISIVEDQRSQIDSIRIRLDKYEAAYGIGRARVAVDNDALNMRSQPSIAGDLITKIPNGAFVGVIATADEEQVIDGTIGRWYQIKYGTYEGWVWGNYLEVLE